MATPTAHPPATDTSTATTAGARDHARAMAGTTVATMPLLPASAVADPPPGVDPAAVVWEETVAGGGYAHKALARGTCVRLVDLEGDACANLVLHHALDPWERLNVADTVKVQWQAYLTAGALLLSDQSRALASVAADTSGVHDALSGSSTRVRNEARYGDGSPQGPSPSARELLVLALAKHGLERRDLPPTISLFKGTRVEADGTFTWREPAGPGAEVVLRTEVPVVLSIANVPHVLDPRPAYTVTNLRITAWTDRPTGPDDPLWSSTPEVERAFLNTADQLTARGIA